MLFRNRIKELDESAAKGCGGLTSDHEIEVVPTLRTGAGVASHRVRVSPVSIRAGSTT
jgi:hypothetical protein